MVSGQTVADELHQTINNALSFLTTALLIFAFIALFVGAFTIFNTFSITIGQRTRELALLRLVGASRRQVFGSVLGEAALTGLLASIVGLGLGVARGAGAEGAAGGIRDLAAVGAARVQGAHADRRAGRRGRRDHPVGDRARLARRADSAGRGAGRPRADDQPAGLRRRRLLAGVVIGLAGWRAAAARRRPSAKVALVGLGALACVHRDGACWFRRSRVRCPSALGRPVAAVFGMPGRLGRENSMRNPRRTAQTAGALMIGIALVSTIAVLGASLSFVGQAQSRQRAPRRLHHRRL